MKIVFVGGGTLGPVTPLLAVAKALKRLAPELTFAWIGTPAGPEAVLVNAAGIPFHSVSVAKLPRHFSPKLFTFPFDWAHARREADRLVDELAPSAIVTAGGYTAVPVILAAARRKIPCVTHQLDLEPGLANKRIAKHCASVTTSFEYERAPFGDWVSDERIATPCRFRSDALPGRAEAAEGFGLDPKRPVTLVFGGGTGAQALNEMLARTLESWLAFTQVLHLTGVGKGEAAQKMRRPGYVVRPLLEAEMASAYAVADLVVSRAGMGALSEIASLKKAAIVVPIPGNQQELNARAFEERGAVVVIDQTSSGFDEEIVTAARLLIHDPEERREMGERAAAFLPTDDGNELARRIVKLLGMRVTATTPTIEAPLARKRRKRID